jgi:hypothetical protein
VRRTYGLAAAAPQLVEDGQQTGGAAALVARLRAPTSHISHHSCLCCFQLDTYLWKPHFSGLLQTSGHGCGPPARGQHTRLHRCRPHSRSSLHSRWHRTSGPPQGASRRSDPHLGVGDDCENPGTSGDRRTCLQVFLTGSEQAAQGPVWQRAGQRWPQGRSLAQVLSQTGTGSRHDVRTTCSWLTDACADRCQCQEDISRGKVPCHRDSVTVESESKRNPGSHLRGKGAGTYGCSPTRIRTTVWQHRQKPNVLAAVQRLATGTATTKVRLATSEHSLLFPAVARNLPHSISTHTHTLLSFLYSNQPAREGHTESKAPHGRHPHTCAAHRTVPAHRQRRRTFAASRT